MFVCMCVRKCVFACVIACSYVFVCVHVSVVCICVLACMCVLVCMCMHVCMCVDMRVCVCMHVRACMRACMRACVRAYIIILCVIGSIQIAKYVWLFACTSDYLQATCLQCIALSYMKVYSHNTSISYLWCTSTNTKVYIIHMPMIWDFINLFACIVKNDNGRLPIIYIRNIKLVTWTFLFISSISCTAVLAL